MLSWRQHSQPSRKEPLSVAALFKTPHAEKPQKRPSPALLRRSAQGVLMLAWLPVGRYAAEAPLAQNAATALPVLAFLGGALLVAWVLGALRIVSIRKSPQTNQAAHLAPSWASAILALGGLLAHLAGNGLALTGLSLGMAGGAAAAQAAAWLTAYDQLNAKEEALSVLAATFVPSALMACCLLFPPFMAHIMAIAGTLGFALLERRTAALEDPHREPDATIKDSKLFRIGATHLLRRYIAAFLLLGIVAGFMLTLFTMGLSTPPNPGTEAFAPLGSVILGGLLALGYARNHEPDFLLTFALSMLVAVVAFFPFYPGTRFNQHLALSVGFIWVVVLYGSFLLVTYEINRICVTTSKTPSIAGLVAVLGGTLLGALAMLLALCSPWFHNAPAGSYPRIMFVTACGAAAILITYVCTNVLLNRDIVRNVRLLARGTFSSTLRLPTDFETPEDDPGKTQYAAARPQSPFTIETRCRDIALQAGLTPREYDVLVILAHGNTMARVQQDLVISEGTAITHRRNLYRKLGVSSKQQLIDYVNGTSSEDAHGEA